MYPQMGGVGSPRPSTMRSRHWALLRWSSADGLVAGRAAAEVEGLSECADQTQPLVVEVAMAEYESVYTGCHSP
jgi:hypothetical protein